MQEVDAQHRLDWKRFAPCRLDRRVRPDQPQERLPRHHALHLVQKYLLARASVAQVQSKVALFHRLINVRESFSDCYD